MKYSYNLDRRVVFAHTSDLNASFKDVCAVCDAVRYKRVPAAIRILEGVINEGRPIEYRRHNKYMGSRHELGGKKGRYPMKCAAACQEGSDRCIGKRKEQGRGSRGHVHSSRIGEQDV